MVTLSTLHPPAGSRKPRKRVGRGTGSGHGKTASRGHKGAKARSGGSRGPGFEGGQMPLQRRLPKRGFTNIFKVDYQIIHVRDLSAFEANTVITSSILQQARKIKSAKKPVKILGDGELLVALTVQVDKCSESAKQKIMAAGGTVEERSA